LVEHKGHNDIGKVENGEMVFELASAWLSLPSITGMSYGDIYVLLLCK